MDNKYTRKEAICPLVGEKCNCEHKDCHICIAEEEEWELEQSRIDYNIKNE